MKLKILYPCDPKKNKDCNKFGCTFVKECSKTTNENYAVDNYSPKDCIIVDEESNTKFVYEEEEKENE